MTHLAWDRGAVTEDGAAMLAVEFGVYVRNKTCKTECGIRVKTELIDNLMPTCVACREVAVKVAVLSREALLRDPERSPERWALIDHATETIERFRIGTRFQ